MKRVCTLAAVALSALFFSPAARAECDGNNEWLRLNCMSGVIEELRKADAGQKQEIASLTDQLTALNAQLGQLRAGLEDLKARHDALAAGYEALDKTRWPKGAVMASLIDGPVPAGWAVCDTLNDGRFLRGNRPLQGQGGSAEHAHPLTVVDGIDGPKLVLSAGPELSAAHVATEAAAALPPYQDVVFLCKEG
ncbi:MAG: hypothetical protein LCH46_08080 [Proteobacteria bacterium]|nr:hypothetical protein [Pseudomonadota bacterium]